LKNANYTSATVCYCYSSGIGIWMNYANSLEELYKVGIPVDSIVIKTY
jgi:hypothetical protein